MPSPLIFQWQGDGFTPLKRHQKECDARFIVGKVYALEEIQERSAASHAHYFAAIKEGWQNLPDEIAERFPTSEHLRKFALVKTGFHDERSIQSSSRAEALRLSAFIKPMDEFAVITVTGSTVTVFTPKSQSYRAMGKADFQRSKDAVLEYISGLLNIEPKELEGASKC